MTDRSFNVEAEGTSQSEQHTSEGSQGPSFESGSEQNSQQTEQNTQTQGQNDGGELDSLRRQIQGLEKRKQDSDNFIDQLKGENREKDQQIKQLKEQLEELQERSKSVEEILERMNSSQSGSGDSPGLTHEEARRLAAEEFNNIQSHQKQQENIQKIASELLQAYGSENIDKQVAKIAQENDMTFDEAFDLAGTKPNAFRRLFLSGKGVGSSEPSAPSGSINTAGMDNQSNRQTKPQKKFFELKSNKDMAAYVQSKAKELGVN